MRLDTQCIDGPGERTRLGYVRLWIGGRRILAHRHAWELINGPVPPGMELDHGCRNRWCRNVDHLEVVTHRVNSQRAGNRKLSHEKASEIRALWAARAGTQVEIGRRFGVSRITVQKIVYGQFWQ